MSLNTSASCPYGESECTDRATAVLGVLVLSQSLTVPTLVGGALVVSAVVVLQFKRERVA